MVSPLKILVTVTSSPTGSAVLVGAAEGPASRLGVIELLVAPVLLEELAALVEVFVMFARSVIATAQNTTAAIPDQTLYAVLNPFLRLHDTVIAQRDSPT
jgi:hypothetical protein